MRLETAPVPLSYAVDGDPGAPPVLCLHGITQSLATWEWLAPDLAGHRVYRLDFRGHGGSGRVEGRYDFPGFVEDAVALCEQVIGEPAVVIGHSLGGATAAAMAQQRPDLVRGVVLEDPPLAAPPSGAELEAALDAGSALLDGFRVMRRSVPELQASGLSVDQLTDILRAAPAFGSGDAFGDLLHEDAIAAMADGMLALDARVLDPVLDGTARPEFDPHAPLPVPGIVLAADPATPDHVTRPGDLARLAEHSPHIECRVVTGSGHLIHDALAHRDAVRTAVADLLARLD